MIKDFRHTHNFLLCIFILLNLSSFSQRIEEGNCSIKNYGAAEIKSSLQILNIVQDKRGVIYASSSAGINEFDGINWNYVKNVPPGVYSLAYDSISGVVYAGSIANDLGYLSFSSKGETEFISLLNYIPEKYKEFGTVYQTFVINNSVFFITRNYIFRIKNGKLRTWVSDGEFHIAFRLGDDLFIKKFNDGIYKITERDLQLVNGSEALADERIYFIIPLKKDEFLIGAKSQGLMRININFLKGGSAVFAINKISRINNELSDFLMNNELYYAKEISNNNIAFCTLKSGLVIASKNLDLYSLISVDQGLQDSYVNNVFEDKQKNIWVATNNGVSCLEYQSPFRYFNRQNKLEGTIEKIQEYDGKIYFASSQGLYVKESQFSTISKIEDIGIECFDLIKIKRKNKESMLIANKNGVSEIYNGEARPLIKNIFARSLYFSEKENKLLVGTMNGVLYMYDFSEKLPIQIYQNIEFGDIILQITQDAKNNFLISTRQNSIFYLKEKSVKISGITSKKFELISYYDSIPEEENRLYKINNELYVGNIKGLFKVLYDSQNNLFFKKTNDFGIEFSLSNDMICFTEDLNNKIWFYTLVRKYGKDKSELGYLERDNGKKYKYLSKKFKYLPDEIIMKAIYPFNQDLTWFGGSFGAISFNKKRKDFSPYIKHKNLIRLIQANNDTVFYGTFFEKVYSKILNQTIATAIYHQTDYINNTFEYQNNNLTFSFCSDSYILLSNNYYSTSLSKLGETESWSPYSKKTERQFTNLSEGNYVFKVRSINTFENYGEIAEFKFTILPPWYRTWWSYIIYLITGTFLVFGIVRLYTKGLNRIINTQTNELQQQKSQIEHKNKEITDSILYAKKIQQAIMPPENIIKEMFFDGFILFKPKDIVSGDFYWASEKENLKIVAAADCTGHGVPGAFMSLMGNENLNEIVNERNIVSPEKVLEELRFNIIRDLKQNTEGSESKDGMDIALTAYDAETRTLYFAGANNPLYFIRKKDISQPKDVIISEQNEEYILYEVKGNKFPVGIFIGGILPAFTLNKLLMKPGDTVYLFSDGFADQFGGPSGKKYKYKQLKKFLLDIQSMPLDVQKQMLAEELSAWQGNLEQVDDILIVGFKIN